MLRSAIARTRREATRRIAGARWRFPIAENRIKSRQRVLKAATIEFGGGAIDCTIRNWSATGAALDVTSPVGIPAHFTLYVAADGRHWPCHVVWRKEKRIGVVFE